MNYISEIRKMMDKAGAESICLVFDKRKTTIQKKGIRYEILEIHKPEEGDTELMLSTIPSYKWGLVYLCLDETWGTSTWDKLLHIVEKKTGG